MQTIVFNRGLEIRIAWAIASGLHDADDRANALLDLFFEAQELGIDDYYDGYTHVPTLFCDEPDLAKAWTAGQHWAEEENKCNDLAYIYGYDPSDDDCGENGFYADDELDF